MPRYRLWVRFESWQWPLQQGDYVEVLTPSLEPVAIVPAELIEAMIANHLDSLALQAGLAQYSDRPDWRQLTEGSPWPNDRHKPADAPRVELPRRKPPARTRDRLYDPARLAALRARRRSRKPKGGAG